MADPGPDVITLGLVAARGASVREGRRSPGLDIRIGPGEVVALVGPNGSGKSSLVRALMGLAEPSSGRVEIAGTTARSYRRRHGIGYLPERPSPSPGWRVSEWVRSAALVRGSPLQEAVEECEAHLAALDLERHAHQRVERLSHGTTRRVALAFALAGEPSLVILDEPLTGLDPSASRRVGTVVLGLRRRSATVVVTAHDLPSIPVSPDRVIVLDGERTGLGGPA